MKKFKDTAENRDHFFRTFHAGRFAFQLLGLVSCAILASAIFFAVQNYASAHITPIQANLISLFSAFILFAGFTKFKAMLHMDMAQHSAKADVSNLLQSAEISLKSHMADIIECCEMLSRKADNHEMAHHISAIINATTQIGTLAENQTHILDLDLNPERGQKAHIDEPEQPSAISKIFEDSLNRAAGYASWNNITIDQNIDDDFGDINQLDVSSLKILVQNILQSVITSHHDTTMQIHIAPIHYNPSFGTVQMQIKVNNQDEAQNIKKLFDTRHQSDLNLYVTNRLLQHLNADISFIDRNILELRIPYSKKVERHTQDSKTQSNWIARAEWHGTVPNILIVDDHPANIMLLHKFASKFRHAKIDEAVSGTEAVQIFNMHRHELIFMDCQMPGMDGLEASRRIREIERIHKAKPAIIIGVTADTTHTTRKKCLDAGMNRLLYKPITSDVVRESVSMYFGDDITCPNGNCEIPKTADNATAEHSLTSEQQSHLVHDKPEHQPVNLKRLRSYTDGDPEEDQMFFNIFIEQARQTLNTLEQTLQDHNIDDWRRAAHKLKGSSANIGADQLAELCQIAEYHDNTITEEDILNAIRSELNKVDAFLNTLNKKNAAAKLNEESKRLH